MANSVIECCLVKTRVFALLVVSRSHFRYSTQPKTIVLFVDTGSILMVGAADFVKTLKQVCYSCLFCFRSNVVFPFLTTGCKTRNFLCCVCVFVYSQTIRQCVPSKSVYPYPTPIGIVDQPYTIPNTLEILRNTNRTRNAHQNEETEPSAKSKNNSDSSVYSVNTSTHLKG